MDDPNYHPSDSGSNLEDEVEEDTMTIENPNGNFTSNDENLNIGSNLVEQSDSESGGSDVEPPRKSEWNDPEGNHMMFGTEYNDSEGISPEYAAALVNENPFTFYSSFVDDQIINLMVRETNLYATQLLTSTEDVPEYSRLHKWTPTTCEEMLKFLGLIGYMGLVKMPSIRHYWSRKQLYRNDVSNVMSRNRFELLLHVWHFSDNDECPPGDRVFKIQPLLDSLIQKYQELYTPGGTFCIDESLIPFRGRLIFKQYLPLKSHKYGIKIFKLCSGEGYTWNMKIYCGKEHDAGASVPTNVVMTLSENLLDKGRTVITDNYYTSLDLANKLLDRKTHLLGTLRSNRKGNPKEVTLKKLKRGEIISKENTRGINIMKWKDKRDVLILSTKHTDTMEEVQSRGSTTLKPRAVSDYNRGKSSIDLSDQMSSYNTALRKTIKWYRKIAIELLFGTSMINAHYLYKKINNSKITITEFREKVYEEMLFSERYKEPDNNEGIATDNRREKRKSEHKFDKKEGPSHKMRKYCVGCYEKKRNGLIVKNKVKKVSTFCNDCTNNPHYCMSCFNESHK